MADKLVNQGDDASAAEAQPTSARPVRVTDAEIEQAREEKQYLTDAYDKFDGGEIYVTGKDDGRDFVVTTEGDAYFLENGEWVEGDAPFSDPNDDVVLDVEDN